MHSIQERKEMYHCVSMIGLTISILLRYPPLEGDLPLEGYIKTWSPHANEGEVFEGKVSLP
jgi:hypothetical protein